MKPIRILIISDCRYILEALEPASQTLFFLRENGVEVFVITEDELTDFTKEWLDIYKLKGNTYSCIPKPGEVITHIAELRGISLDNIAMLGVGPYLVKSKKYVGLVGNAPFNEGLVEMAEYVIERNMSNG